MGESGIFAIGQLLRCVTFTSKAGKDLVVVKVLCDEEIVEGVGDPDALAGGELPAKGTEVAVKVNPKGDDTGSGAVRYWVLSVKPTGNASSASNGASTAKAAS